MRITTEPSRCARSSMWRSAVAAIIALPVACNPPSDPQPSNRDAEIERLRSLPYAAGTPSDGDSGISAYDASRSDPGVNFVAIPPLGRAELVDAAGTVLDSWEAPEAKRIVRAKMLRNGDVLMVGADRSELPAGAPQEVMPDATRFLLRLNREGERIWKRYMTAHHDVYESEDGELLVLTFTRRVVPRIHNSIPVRDDQLTWIKPDGTVSKTVSLFDAAMRSADAFTLHGVKPSSLGGPPWFDCFHANSIYVIHRPELATRHPLYEPGNVLISLRHQDSIIVVNPGSGHIVWSWGRGELRGPHDATLLDNGNILLFDNGLGRGYSRAVELDPVARKIVWEYRARPPHAFYTASKGSAQRLPNGNTLLAESDTGRAFEVTKAGEIVWEYRCPYEASPGVRAAISRMVRLPESIIEERDNDAEPQ